MGPGFFVAMVTFINKFFLVLHTFFFFYCFPGHLLRKIKYFYLLIRILLSGTLSGTYKEFTQQLNGRMGAMKIERSTGQF